MGRKIWQFIKGSIFVLSAIFIGLVISFLIINIKEKNTLYKELSEYTSKNLDTDNFKINIKTKGDYAYIEKLVKKFYKDLSDNVKDINYYLNNEDFMTILSVNQLQQNRPNYTYNHVTIKSTKSKVNKAINNIKNLCDEDNIKKLLNKKKLTKGMENYLYDLYLDYIYNEDDATRLDNTKEEMENLSIQLNEFLDKIDEILVFLNKNDATLVFNKDSISFSDDDVLEEYKKLYDDLVKVGLNMTIEEKDNL